MRKTENNQYFSAYFAVFKFCFAKFRGIWPELSYLIQNYQNFAYVSGFVFEDEGIYNGIIAYTKIFVEFCNEIVANCLK